MGVIVEFFLPQFLSPILLELHSPACRKLDFNTLNKKFSHIINIEMHDHWYWFSGSVTSRPVTLILLAFPHGCRMINVAPAIMTIFKIGKKRKWEGLGMHEQYLWNKTKTKKHFSKLYFLIILLFMFHCLKPGQVPILRYKGGWESRNKSYSDWLNQWYIFWCQMMIGNECWWHS